jgi:hypothetical protein
MDQENAVVSGEGYELKKLGIPVYVQVPRMTVAPIDNLGYDSEFKNRSRLA